MTFSFSYSGFSDPFCVLMVDGKKVFTTNIKKKTLFPKWNETVTLELPADDTSFALVQISFLFHHKKS